MNSTEAIIIETEKKAAVPFWTSYRFRLAILCCVGFMLTFTHRSDLSLAMVCMVNDTVDGNTTEGIKSSPPPVGTTISYSSNQSQEVSDDSNNVCLIETKKKNMGGQFKWSKELQGIMLGSFFWGYLVFQIPGGWMARRFGAKKIISIGILSGSVLNLVTPWCARATPYLLIANRVLSGLGHSVIYPAGQYFFTKWCPSEEKSRIISLIFAGPVIGIAATFPVSGILCDYGVDGGWPSIFYLLGALGIIWSFVWILYAHDSPDEAPRLDAVEKHYLEQTVPPSKSDCKKTPWIRILTSRPTWACVFAHLSMNYGLFMMMTQLPTYMNEVLRFTIMSNGFFLALPYVGMFIVTAISGYVSDKLIDTKTLSKKWTRKIIAAIGFIVPAILLVVMGLWDCMQQTPAVVTLITLVAFSGLQMTSVVVNYTDFGGQFVGILHGIGNLIAAVSGIVAPYLVAAITPNKSREEWMNTFIIAACIYAAGALIYCTLTKFEEQPWAGGESASNTGLDTDSSANTISRPSQRNSIGL